MSAVQKEEFDFTRTISENLQSIRVLVSERLQLTREIHEEEKAFLRHEIALRDDRIVALENMNRIMAAEIDKLRNKSAL